LRVVGQASPRASEMAFLVVGLPAEPFGAVLCCRVLVAELLVYLGSHEVTLNVVGAVSPGLAQVAQLFLEVLLPVPRKGPLRPRGGQSRPQSQHLAEIVGGCVPLAAANVNSPTPEIATRRVRITGDTCGVPLDRLPIVEQVVVAQRQQEPGTDLARLVAGGA